MAIVRKTKEERGRDIPLPESPDVLSPITDIKSALSDIESRSAARQKSTTESRNKLNAAREARNRNRKPLSGGSLQGLASFSDRTKLK